MIERRYPIQTVLAERKMFAGGGAVLPQQMMPQQMMPQQLMPQQMMPPQQSGGILASSGPHKKSLLISVLRTLRPLTPLAVPWWISVLMNQKPLTLVL